LRDRQLTALRRAAGPPVGSNLLAWAEVPRGAWIVARAFAAPQSIPLVRALLSYPVWLGLVATYRLHGWATGGPGACAMLRPAALPSRRLVTQAALLTTAFWALLLGLVAAAGRRWPAPARPIVGAAIDAWFLGAAFARWPPRRSPAYRRAVADLGTAAWWIDILAAWPTGRGSGGALLRQLLARGAATGTAWCLVSLDPRNRSLYDRYMDRLVQVVLGDGRDAVFYRTEILTRNGPNALTVLSPAGEHMPEPESSGASSTVGRPRRK
jgi:hypothetical protein